MSNPDRTRSDRDDSDRGSNLRDSEMMARLLDALDQGVDIGHYGRLVFVMVARFFISEDEMVELLRNQPDFDEKDARALVLQVKAHDYNPPQREVILEWQENQDYKICTWPEDPRACNVYRELQFPNGIYDQIDDFWEEKVEAEEEEGN